MALPLTKRSAKDGKTYTRPSDDEANIDGAIGNSLATLEQRLQIAQPTSPGFSWNAVMSTFEERSRSSVDRASRSR